MERMQRLMRRVCVGLKSAMGGMVEIDVLRFRLFMVLTTNMRLSLESVCQGDNA